MTRLFAVVLTLTALVLSGCDTTTMPGTEGKPVPKVYRLRAGDLPEVQYRMLDAVNALRQANGTAPVQLDARLNAAAQTHARDMSRQNRPWHFGSDGSSPLDRVRRAGYEGILVGENISETFETELETLAAWMEQKDTRNVVLSPKATHLGFGYHQEPGGKIWWTLVTGGPGRDPAQVAAEAAAQAAG